MKLVQEVVDYIEQLFRGLDKSKFIYHNLSHTLDVAKYSEIIADHVGLSEDEKELVIISAWFHDVGYTVDYDNHEEKGKELAEKFLTSKGIDDSKIQTILSCIDATKVPQNPKNKLEEVLCDADMYHLSQPDFCEKSALLRLEQNKLRSKKTSKLKFMRETLRYLNNSYFTQFANETLTPGKKKNIGIITEKINSRLEQKKSNPVKKPVNDQLNELIKDNKKLKARLASKQSPTRGVESMFRLTARNQINLSSIADNKSNILITVTSLIISVVITLLARKYYELPHLIIPAIIFLLTCLITMIFAILSTRPNISKGQFTEEDIRQKKVNLLFFGNFYNMSLDNYEWAVKEMMKDNKHLYEVMIKDQYYLGKVLAKKYKLLRSAYTIFMFGFIISILAFAIAMFTYTG